MPLAPTTRDTLLKIASASADNKQVETAFADMVSVAVANKAGPLLQNGRHIGFEIIKQNEDNTHMLGVSVFRLGNSSADDLVYAPAIFSNGKLVGTNLLYRVGPKKFTPFKPDWCQFLLDLSSRSAGRPILKTETAKLTPMTNWHMLSSPPGVLKSATKAASTRITDPAAVDEMMNLIMKKASVAPVLRDFMIQAGIGALQTLDNTCAARPKFASALAQLGEDTFMPPELVQRAQEGNVKRAAAEGALHMPTLLLTVGPPDRELCKRANVNMDEAMIGRLFKVGYSIDPVLDTPVPEHRTLAYEGTPAAQFMSPGPAGKARLLLAGGTTADVIVGNSLDAYDLFSRDDATSGCFPPSNCGSGGLNATRRTAVALDKPATFEGHSPLYLIPSLEEGLDTVGCSLKDIEAPGLFSLVDPVNDSITRPVWVDSAKKGDDGVVELAVATYSGSDLRTLLFNPTLPQSETQRNGVLGPAWRAVRVVYNKVEAPDTAQPAFVGHGGVSKRAPSWEMKELIPGSDSDLRNFINELPNLKKASLVHENGLFDLTVGDTTCQAESRHGAAVKLACLQVAPSDIEQLLDSAVTNRRAEFTLDFEKTAGMLQVIDQPRWQQRFDSVHNVQLEVPQAFALRTYKSPVMLPAPRIGDRLVPIGGQNHAVEDSIKSHEVPTDLILNGSPEDIGAHAQSIGAPHVFDHAVLGSLARTYDSAKLLEGFIPKLEDGVDYLGRSIFLFYWRPEDWRNLYGKDDLMEIEQKLNSVFDNMGDVVLDLLKKTRTAAST